MNGCSSFFQSDQTKMIFFLQEILPLKNTDLKKKKKKKILLEWTHDEDETSWW